MLTPAPRMRKEVVRHLAAGTRAEIVENGRMSLRRPKPE
jgi:hypothetical protein